MRPPRTLSIERLEHMARNALLGGYGHVVPWRDDPRDRYRGGPRRLVKIDVAMDCEVPHVVELHSRHSATHRLRRPPLACIIHARCRRCKTCKERRRVFWQGRAFSEYNAAYRTIFGTLTVSPEWDYVLDQRAFVRLAERGVNFDDLPEGEKFCERVKEGGFEITDYLKRLRGDRKAKRSPVFRYLLIAEAHSAHGAKQGRPHWHVLFHETDEMRPLVLPDEWLKKADGSIRTDKHGNALVDNSAYIKRHWKLGFSSFALAGTVQAATYLCKYLTKEASVRIRASYLYGGEDHHKNLGGLSDPTISEPVGEACKLDPPRKSQVD